MDSNLFGFDIDSHLLGRISFIYEIDTLKNIFRRTKISSNDRFENDAEHSWHIAMMALVMAPYFEAENKKIDVGRVIKMLLLHDIVEIDAGDTYCYDMEAAKTKADRENKAADRIFGLLPDDKKQEFLELWNEFDEEKTEDAIFAAIMDKIQPLMLNYYNYGESWIINNVTKNQVLKRMDIAINKAPEPIRNFVLNLIDEAAEKGYLLP